MTQLEKDMRVAAEKATPGPWRVNETIIHGASYGINGVSPVNEFSVETIHNHGVKSWSDFIAVPAHAHVTDFDQEAGRNMQYIALANPANVLKLLDKLRVARTRLEQLANPRFYNFDECDSATVLKFTREALSEMEGEA